MLTRLLKNRASEAAQAILHLTWVKARKFMIMKLILNAAPQFEVNAAEGKVEMSAKVGILYRGKQKFSVYIIFSTSYNTVQYRIYGKGFTGYEPFIQKWVERFKAVNPVWESQLKRNVIQPKEAIIGAFSKWAKVTVINDHDYDSFVDYKHLPTKTRARRKLWNKRLVPYRGISHYQ